MSILASLMWPARDVGTALEALAQRSSLAPRSVHAPAAPQAVAEDREKLATWIESTAAWLNLEAEPIVIPYQDADELLQGVAPALLSIENGTSPNFVALLKSSRRSVALLTPDLHVVDVPAEKLRHELCAHLESPLLAEIEDFLTEMGVGDNRRVSARRELLRHRLRSRYLGGCWSLRSSPGASIWAQAHRAGLPSRALMLAGAHAVEYALWIVSWWLVGRAALAGRLEYGWMFGWALLLLTIVPFRLVGTWLQGIVAIGSGVLLKQRLLYGALRVEPEEVRHKGVGEFLGEVMESQAVESLALSGGFLSVLATIELIAALIVVGLARGGGLLILLLIAWLLLTGALVGTYFRRRRRWTQARLHITQNLTEVMVGHRTRLVQEPHEKWHTAEDASLERYLDLSQSMDRTSAALNALVPRGWLLVGIIGLTPGLASSAASAVSIATSLGGILLAYRALRELVSGLMSSSDAAISWRRVAPLFHAAARPESVSVPAVSMRGGGNGACRTVAEADDIVFRYPGRGEPVLSGCKLDIRSGDRLLLEGASGGGKSTLASLLAGVRQPQSGLLLLGGLDRATLGANGWRRRVVSAPQFHENHVLTETFAFNLLMGKRWPPALEDLQQAETICRELGLEELIQRMPGGLLQMVGETGWRLSHGERSRLYIARALLQGADLIILDESFAALDPENLRRCLHTVLQRVATLLVIAHP